MCGVKKNGARWANLAAYIQQWVRCMRAQAGHYGHEICCESRTFHGGPLSSYVICEGRIRLDLTCAVRSLMTFSRKHNVAICAAEWLSCMLLQVVSGEIRTWAKLAGLDLLYLLLQLLERLERLRLPLERDLEE
jgi:hypothetical protein